MTILITEGYLEKCLEKDDICLKEISTAFELNKEVAIVTNIKREEIRKILNYEGIPDTLKKLKEVNMLYVDTEVNIRESVSKILSSIEEIDKKIDIANNTEMHSYDEGYSIKNIQEKIFEIDNEAYTYEGVRKNNKFLGSGKLIGLENKIVIEGEFDCYRESICGNFKMYKKGKLIFVGTIEEINSIRNLNFRGEGSLLLDDYRAGGLLESGDYIGEGRIIDGKLDGYVKVRSKNGKYLYEGFFKDGKRQGEGSFIIEDSNEILKVKTYFSNDEINGDLYIEDRVRNIEYNICRDDLVKLKENNNNVDLVDLTNYSSIYIKFNENYEKTIGVEISDNFKEKFKGLAFELGMINFKNKNILTRVQIDEERKDSAVIAIYENNTLKVGMSILLDTMCLKEIIYNIENGLNDFKIVNGCIDNTEIGECEAKLLFNAESQRYIEDSCDKGKIRENHKIMHTLAQLNYIADKNVRKIVKILGL